MKFERSSGIILHPTSLPGPYGIGDIGPQAHRWLDWLAGAGSSLWQVLPLGPTGYGDSPYQSFSAFAGNPYIISLELLLDDDLLQTEDLADKPAFPAERVDFGALIPWKLQVLDRAYQRFEKTRKKSLHQAYQEFQEAQSYWIDDFALFMALKDAHGGQPWPTWEASLRDRDPEAIEQARQEQQETIERQKFRQFIFFRQWAALREHAGELGIKIIGDMPIFVAHDSADVWAHPELFYLNEKGNPTVVAGVPPDYFSPTGQLWGNPLYRWNVHKKNGYTWWLNRIKSVLQLVDIVRLDHFRGFSGYWEVSADKPTAEIGRWVKGPGADIFKTIKKELGELPIIAEDLGLITHDVVELREQFDLPGMKILQFAFSSTPSDPFLPHNYPRNCVVYTGTHDNDTTWGWYRTAPEKERDFCRRYLARDGSDIAWSMMRAIWASVAIFALAPMQDLLNLDTDARMNFPGHPSGNWSWRMAPDAINAELSNRLMEYNYLYGRKPKTAEDVAKAEEEQAEVEAQVEYETA